MIKMNIKSLKLKEVNLTNFIIFQLFSSEKIIKVFHDCLEDLSLLNSFGKYNQFNSIFDTQIAHRMCYYDENNCNNIGTKNISISLKELLKNYFNYTSELKDEIHELMSNKPDLWRNRPLTDKLIYYAGCDVKYLPKVYDIICKKCDKGKYKTVTIEKILNEFKKYLKYLNINKDIKIFNRINLNKGDILLGLIKNFQQRCAFVQLNIGYFGIVTDYNSVSLLKENYKLGDIIQFKIVEVNHDKKKLILDIYNSKDEKMEIEEETNKNLESNNKVIHEGLNINKKSFFPKSYLNKYHNDNSLNENNKINYNYYEYNNNNINNINQPNNGIYFNNNYQNNINNGGWLYNGDSNAYYYEQPDENNSNNFYYVINRFQENNQSRYGRYYK